MNEIQQLLSRGGPAIVALMVLSVLLYGRCIYLLLYLKMGRSALRRVSVAELQEPARLRQIQAELNDSYTQHRMAIGAMITAAPLLGLLGTVMGMIGAFNSLSAHGNQHSMEGLAHGISEVLIDTESGLAVAIPALLLLYYAHRQLQKGTQVLSGLENTWREGL